MKKLAIMVIIGVAIYAYVQWEPSAVSIAQNMQVSEKIVFENDTYTTDWKKAARIDGHLRRSDRESYDYAPIITYHLVITTDDYNDPDLVKISNKGHGKYTYLYRNDIPLKGGLTVYHVIPASATVQRSLEELKSGKPIRLVAQVSKSSTLKKNGQAVFRVNGQNHKVILVEQVL